MTEKQAAVIVQKKWRGYIARKKVKKQRAEELEFIGMVASEPKAEKSEHISAGKVEEIRRERLIKHEVEYQRALVDIKQNLLDTKGPEIREQLQAGFEIFPNFLAPAQLRLQFFLLGGNKNV